MESKKMKAPAMKERGKESGMIDNRMVSDNHQQGISRITGIGKTMCKGQGGKMSSTSGGADFGRSSVGTPRKA